ncbi:MAG TPA: peptidylprolyl isomerase [Gaiellaceae bacterium]|jgi:foldase protein PrsA
MRLSLLTLLLVPLVLLAAACGSSGPQSVPSDDVAVVGDDGVSKADWDALIEQTKNNFKATNKPFPKAGTVELANLKANATQFLIQSNEYQQEADKLKVSVSDSDVDKRLQQIKDQYYGNPPGQPKASKQQEETRYQQALKQQGFTDEQVRQGIKLQLIREKVFKEVTKDVKVSDDQITSYYNKNKKQYETPAQPESRDLRHILIGCTTKAKCAKAKKTADSVYAQLQANPNKFAALAKRYSTDTSSAANGGKLPPGVGVKGHLVPEFEKVAFTIKTDVISKPVKSQFGYHIIEALGPIKAGTPAKPTPLSQVKEAIRQQLLSSDQQKEMDKWLADMKKTYCKKIGYQKGYEPPPGQDPCKTSSSTTGGATTTG